MLIYTLVVSNAGPSDAQGIVITDTLPDGLTLLSAAPPQLSGPNPLVWNLDLAAGQVEYIQLQQPSLRLAQASCATKQGFPATLIHSL